jgi:hypothetical protein
MQTTTATTTVLTGIRINTDGTLEDVRIKNTTDLSRLEALNRAVGSDLFDVVGLPGGIDVFVDDEGLYRAETNPVLSAIVSALAAENQTYRLFGAGVFLAADGRTGDTVSLTVRQRTRIAATWFDLAPLAVL